MQLSFMHNISRDTWQARSTKHLRPAGYLIAPDNVRGQLGVITRDVAETSRLELFLDNGNFESIGKIRKEFSSAAEELWREVRAIERALGRSVTRRDMPRALRARYDRLDREVRARAQSLNLDAATMLETQLEHDPTRIVGVEDITMASWLSLNIEPRYVSRRRRDYRRQNAAVARAGQRVQSQLPTHLGDAYYPVASAVSYNTAFDAGREFAFRGLDSIAMGFGAFMADNNFVDHMTIGRRRHHFGSALPARYVRTAEVARGFWRGYETEAGRGPKRFHFLGLGAPIMFPVVAVAARDSAELTFDATSPMKDATKGGTLYIDKPAVLKIRIRKVALRLARERTHAWGCPCPFCEAFVANHPFDYAKGWAWFGRVGATKVQAADLRPGGALFDAYPLLSEPAPGDLRRLINYTRTGHNHWIVERVLASTESADRDGRLTTRATNIIEQYTNQTTRPFAKALTVSLATALGELD